MCGCVRGDGCAGAQVRLDTLLHGYLLVYKDASSEVCVRMCPLCECLNIREGGVHMPGGGGRSSEAAAIFTRQIIHSQVRIHIRKHKPYTYAHTHTLTLARTRTSLAGFARLLQRVHDETERHAQKHGAILEERLLEHVHLTYV